MTASCPSPSQDSPLQRLTRRLMSPGSGRWVASLALALGAGLGVPQAQASSVVWSVGIASPGAVVHVGHPPPPRVVYQPVPVQVVVPPVVMAPGWGPPPHRMGPPAGWYGPHAGMGHRRHHWNHYDEHRAGPRHGHRGDDRGGAYVRPVDPRWEHHRR